ncbi:hypothetical protein V1478_007503 [Vespula squamosa]|uniref:Uncharacterized protein n=1 Tax=Vespula squamosa TaxID=30214 RepID=A0ABD2B3F1_VESSQ
MEKNGFIIWRENDEQFEVDRLYRGRTLHVVRSMIFNVHHRCKKHLRSLERGRENMATAW